jgi:hypothetical protein
MALRIVGPLQARHGAFAFCRQQDAGLSVDFDAVAGVAAVQRCQETFVDLHRMSSRKFETNYWPTIFSILYHNVHAKKL